MRSLLAAAFCCYGALAAGVAWAEPYVEHLEPPSVGRGAKNRLAVVGSAVDRPVGLWTSLPAGKFQVARAVGSSRERSEFEIDVAADCPLGLYGLRLATEDGLSNLCLFVVDDLLPRTALADPQTEFPVALAGELKSAAVDRYRIQVSSGQKLSFDVVASRLGTDADPLVTIYDHAGRRIAQHDNDPGLFFDCCFEQTFEQAGIYTVEVRDARYLGSPHWRYLLRMGSFPAARVAIPSAVKPGEAAVLKFPELGGEGIKFDVPADEPLGGFYYDLRRPGGVGRPAPNADAASNWIPLLASDLRSAVEAEPNDQPEEATPSGEAPVFLHGVIDQPGDRDHFALDLKAGQKLTIRAETRPLGSAADVELALFDATGRELQRNDDVTLPGNLLEEATLNVNIGKEGQYKLHVREMSESGGPQFTYRVEVRPVTPRIQLSSDVADFTIPQQSYVRLPITVVRTDFTGPIELSIVGAPPGLTLEPNVIPEGATSLDAKLIAAENAPQGIFTLTIEGKAQAGDVPLTAQLTVQPLVDRQLLNVDLIKYALRDCQRYLPPSITHRLAVQITPPSPFTVELDESLVTLPRYQHVELKIITTRSAGFEGPIAFSASGGQLGQESQGRRQVFGRFPIATKDQAVATATIHSRSQAQELKERIDLVATASHNGREINLFRSFTLDCRPALAISAEPLPGPIAPGQTVKVKLSVSRLPAFAGPVTIERALNPNVTAPEIVTIAAGDQSVEIDVAIAADAKPGKQRIRFTATGQVGRFLEETKPLDFDLEIKAEKKP